jgi:hypothetical protein
MEFDVGSSQTPVGGTAAKAMIHTGTRRANAPCTTVKPLWNAPMRPAVAKSYPEISHKSRNQPRSWNFDVGSSQTPVGGVAVTAMIHTCTRCANAPCVTVKPLRSAPMDPAVAKSKKDLIQHRFPCRLEPRREKRKFPTNPEISLGHGIWTSGRRKHL